MRSGEMKVTYIDPNGRALYAGELPDGGYGVWAQKDKEAPRKLVSKGYIKPEGYGTFDKAQEALGLYVSNERNTSRYGSWETYVNGKFVTYDKYCAMCRGDLPVPQYIAPPAQVTLANIEYRIATHIQGAYENILEVGRCLNEAKDAGLVAHGQWEAWVRQNTGMSERSAQKLMQAARSVNEGSMMNKLPISKIQAILALPQEEREPMAEKAVADDMSLRELQEEIRLVKAEKDRLELVAKKAEERAERYLDAQMASEKHRAEMEERLAAMQRDIPVMAERLVDEQTREMEQEVERLRTELEAAEMYAQQQAELAQAQQDAPAEGISSEARAEIERLKAELADAEAYAEQQAEQRQQAQRDMLAMQAQAARGETAASDTLTGYDLAAAVRQFIGTAGVLPHMGATLCGMSEGERQQITQYVDMVDDWVRGARTALGMVTGDYFEIGGEA